MVLSQNVVLVTWDGTECEYAFGEVVYISGLAVRNLVGDGASIAVLEGSETERDRDQDCSYRFSSISHADVESMHG